MKLQILNMTEKEQYEARRSPTSTDHIDHSLNPCEACLAPCCTKTVWLSGTEAARIARALSLSFSDFVVAGPHEEFEGQVDLTAWHPMELEEGPVRLRLRQREDKGCVFRFHVNGRARCGNYANRPGTCRVYPHAWLDGDGKHHFVGTTDVCQVRWLFDENSVRGLEAELKRWRADAKLDKKLCARWNKAFAKKESAERTLDALGEFLVAGLGD
jgi:Fe-S-cluster containining protein